MKYPNHKNYGFSSSPTPCDLLIICDKCQEATWTTDMPMQKYCMYNSKHGRMRKAKLKEIQEAKKCLS